ncbi:hypothetical protein EJ08DRAFT_92754 [Tothia fuscella]|uniref:Uncharacterized protein n=1 Tax=Tothia fuscella TaxID=1048955 RepID=A0A9P4NWV0_9PEZI|nr:hypothetical protein EJ08DRAFT_92754 [Tothia fuscella]
METFNFLGLPRELRDMVYKNAIAFPRLTEYLRKPRPDSNADISEIPTSINATTIKAHTIHPFLYLNHQTNVEFSAVREKQSHLTATILVGRQAGNCGLTSLTPHHLQHLKTLDIIIRFDESLLDYQTGKAPFVRLVAIRLRNFMVALPQLASLRLTTETTPSETGLIFKGMLQALQRSMTLVTLTVNAFHDYGDQSLCYTGKIYGSQTVYVKDKDGYSTVKHNLVGSLDHNCKVWCDCSTDKPNRGLKLIPTGELESLTEALDGRRGDICYFLYCGGV